MAIIDIPTGRLPYVVVETLPEQGEENVIYGVPKDGFANTDYRYVNGEWQEVDLGSTVYGFQFADYQEEVAGTVAEMEATIAEQGTLIAEQAALIQELEEAVFPSSKATVLYDDGTLIINEPSEVREHNITAHGAVVAEYPPLDKENGYVFNSRKDQPWVNEKDAIYRAAFGSFTEPTVMNFWFQGCSNLQEVDWEHFNGSKNTLCRATFADTWLEHLSFPYMPRLESIQYICKSCEHLQDADFTNAKATNVTNTTDAFQGCYNLSEIDISGLAGSVDLCERMFANVSGDGKGDMTIQRIYSDGNLKFWQATQSTNMFRSCTSLVGGLGTTFKSDVANKDYARIDTLDEPGYFTEATQKGDMR